MMLCASCVQEEILVVINNHIITRQAFQKKVDIYYRERAAEKIAINKYLAREKTLQNIIDTYILMDKANDLGIAISEDEFHIYVDDIKKKFGIASDIELELNIKKNLGIDLEFFLDHLRQDIISMEVIRRGILLQILVTHQEMQKYYEEHKNEYKKNCHFRIRELVLSKGNTKEEMITTEKQLHEIQEQLKIKGNFELLAKIYSIAPSSNSGGDLGWVSANVLHPALEAALLALPTSGQVTNPIEINKEIYLLQLTDIERSGIKPYEEVRDLIEEKLKEIKTRHATDAYMNSLKARADIRYVVPREIILKG
jgi:hypothetical protein